jgi:hypothetical protein
MKFSSHRMIRPNKSHWSSVDIFQTGTELPSCFKNAMPVLTERALQEKTLWGSSPSISAPCPRGSEPACCLFSSLTFPWRHLWSCPGAVRWADFWNVVGGKETFSWTLLGPPAFQLVCFLCFPILYKIRTCIHSEPGCHIDLVTKWNEIKYVYALINSQFQWYTSISYLVRRYNWKS